MIDKIQMSMSYGMQQGLPSKSNNGALANLYTTYETNTGRDEFDSIR